MSNPEGIWFRNRYWVVYETPEKKWNPPFWHQVRDGQWEPQTYNVFDRFVTSDMTYLDLGAWIGPTVMYAVSLAKRAIAVEPDPVAFPLLQQHVSANNLVVELHNEAITSFNGTITLGAESLGASTTRANPSGGGRQADWKQTCEVNCHTLAEFVAKHNISGPMFIKMDIEGAEEEVLKDKQFFEILKPTLYLSLHPFWWKNENAWETIRTIGRMYNKVYDNSLNLVNIDTVNSSEVLFVN